MDDNLRREIILDNYQEPFHKGLVEEDGYCKINTSSKSCIDNLDFILKKNGDIIEDIRFDGEACAISTSASSILIRKLIGKKEEEAIQILENYRNMIEEKEYDEELLGELTVYDQISKQPNRKNCALLPNVAIEKLLGVMNHGKQHASDEEFKTC
ncbi:MAG: SUF system NifU family Fe-S cluster assembly protein [Bacilli bacterium]|nr:SUF system NifU family Fe-S cluster assembly protein [Bacilli bacterium]